MKEYDTPMFTAHRSIGKSSENLLGFASEVFFGFSILLLALNIGIYQARHHRGLEASREAEEGNRLTDLR